jgi:hypothetical protein
MNDEWRIGKGVGYMCIVECKKNIYEWKAILWLVENNAEGYDSGNKPSGVSSSVGHTEGKGKVVPVL